MGRLKTQVEGKRRHPIILLTLLALFAVGCGTVDVQANDPGYFPMGQGTRWIYDVHAEISEGPSKVATRDFALTSQVEESIGKGNIRAARLSGFPLAMDVWEAGSKPVEEVLLVNILASQYHLLKDQRALRRFKDPEDMLVGLVKEGSLILDCPLIEGKRFGEFSELARPDGMYCWEVESKTWSRLTGIRGVSPWKRYPCYHLLMRTMPDYVKMVFVPGIGIVDYTYHHNGTSCDVRMKLKEFRKGTP